ncbi:sensor histidine kinase [Pseudoalteromonas sp. S16_S37]|uniref:sensor histidine kinase n=1 Tax=Pseudoalteromonas sp. S16_S37 TaxID=2720228 RepID=UPI0016817876|nr:histidine kinase [Pseudoalteromonas sp. S16_S37]MBD1583398.1 histidine kinase [Pseudoalteromonas sp. S16_S37]
MFTSLFIRRFAWGQLLLWGALALLTRFTWLDVKPPEWIWIFSYMALGALFSSLLFVAYQPILRWHVAAQLAMALALSVVAGLAWRASFNALEYHVLESANNKFHFWGYFHNGKSAVTQLLLWSCGFWLWHYQKRTQLQSKQQDKLQQQARDAQLKLLQFQIDPHFLFNVLASVDTLLLKKDSNTARNMLNKLSSYLRHTLTLEPPLTQPLSKELTRCRHYLDIEKMRFADTLSIEWHVPESLPQVALPTGILLPLLENAVKHGAAAQTSHSSIGIALETQPHSLIIKMSNPCASLSAAKNINNNKGTGMGLYNTKQRLQTFYGNSATLAYGQQGDLFIVTMTVPL